MPESARVTTARWFAVAALMAVIFGLSSMPGSAIPGTVADYSLVAHFTEYALLGALAIGAAGAGKTGARLAVIVLLACSLYGASDEFHQSFTPGRTPDPVDWATDTVGAAAGIAAILIVRRRRS